MGPLRSSSRERPTATRSLSGTSSIRSPKIFAASQVESSNGRIRQTREPRNVEDVPSGVPRPGGGLRNVGSSFGDGLRVYLRHCADDARPRLLYSRRTLPADDSLRAVVDGGEDRLLWCGPRRILQPFQ